MKIISKEKDYYDYLQGIYGIDNKRVLDRTIYPISKYLPSYDSEDYVSFTIFIGNYEINGYYKNNKIYVGKSAFDEYIKTYEGWLSDRPSNYVKQEMKKIKEFTKKKFLLINKSLKSITYKYDFPIIIQWKPIRNDWIEIPNILLKEFKVPTIIPDKTAYMMIENWLAERETQKENIEEPKDEIKIINKGFDLKESFRHRKWIIQKIN